MVKTIIKRRYSGPYIGILTSDGGSPFQGNHYNFADIIRMGKKMGIAVFVVTPKSFGEEDSSVTGYVLDHDSKKIRWQKANLPLPNAIYNRIPTRKVEQSKPIQEALSILQKKNIPLFNPTFFNKWQLYQQLSSSPQLKHLVPQSVLLNTPISLQKMILRHSTIYLKPIDGKAGIGMMRITHDPKGFHLVYQSADDKQYLTFTNFSTLWKKISRFTEQTPYVIQQGIRLAQYQGSPFDLRMLLQKDKEGKWKVTGIGTRVAGKTAISTHVPQGGRIELADQVLEEVFSESKDEIFNYVSEMGLRTAHFIEEQQNGILGEMSIDWGLDEEGEVWFFEANSRPMKFDEPPIRFLSLQRIIQYSVYLSKGVAHHAAPQLFT